MNHWSDTNNNNAEFRVTLLHQTFFRGILHNCMSVSLPENRCETFLSSISGGAQAVTGFSWLKLEGNSRHVAGLTALWRYINFVLLPIWRLWCVQWEPAVFEGHNDVGAGGSRCRFPEAGTRPQTDGGRKLPKLCGESAQHGAWEETFGRKSTPRGRGMDRFGVVLTFTGLRILEWIYRSIHWRPELFVAVVSLLRIPNM